MQKKQAGASQEGLEEKSNVSSMICYGYIEYKAENTKKVMMGGGDFFSGVERDVQFEIIPDMLDLFA